jgi:hypothetical protein
MEQPSVGALARVAEGSSISLLDRDQVAAPKTHLLADMRDHSIDLIIAGLYLAGSGFPGVSDEIAWEANAFASVLWITDSCVRMVARIRRYQKNKKTYCLKEIVVDQ